MATLPVKAWIVIKDGKTEIDYVNRFPLHSGRYAIKENPPLELTGQQPTVTEHDNDDGPPEVINLEEQNRRWSFQITVTGTSEADISKYLSDLKRHVQGKQSTAYQAYLNRSQPDVVFRVQLNSTASSPITEFIIQEGNIPDGRSYYTTAALQNTLALDVNVNLRCSPAGRGELISLRNDLPSSPHMIEDSDGDGTADGVNNTGGGFGWSSLTLGSGGLIGGQYQINTAFSGAVTRSALTNTVTASISSDIVAYFICRISTGDPVRLYLQDGSGNNIETKTLQLNDAGNVADTSYTDSDGNVWYKVSLSGQNTSAANCRLRWERNSADNTGAGVIFWIDALYLEVGQTVVPVAFSSASSLENRYDPSAGNEGRINYLDVWNVPGDMPTEVKLTKVNATGGFQQIVAHNYSGIYEANDPKFTIDSTEFAAGGGWAHVASAGLWSGGYMNSTIPNASPCELNLISSGTAFPIYTTFNRPIRVFAVCWASDAGTTFSMRGSFGNKVLERTPEKSVFATSQYEVLDLGVLNLSGVIDQVDTNNATFNFEIFATGTTGTARVNGVYLLRTDNFVIHPSTESKGFTSYSETQDAYNGTESGGQAYLIGSSGTIAKITPKKMNRLTFLQAGISQLADQRYIPTDAFSVSLEITPITSHLIGE